MFGVLIFSFFWNCLLNDILKIKYFVFLLSDVWKDREINNFLLIGKFCNMLIYYVIIIIEIFDFLKKNNNNYFAFFD